MSGRSRMGAWRPYNEAVDSAPFEPGVYEVRWDRDNEDKPRYIGYSKDLHERLYNYAYKYKESDVGRFIATHMDSPNHPPLVRYKVMPTDDAAYYEEGRRLEDFEKKFGHLPMYNSRH